MSLEIVFFLGAFLLLVAMIYGTLSWHYRNRAAVGAADEITQSRYREQDTGQGELFGGEVPRKVRQPVGIEPGFSEDDIQRARFGPRGVPGAADHAVMTPQRAKKTPTTIDQGHCLRGTSSFRGALFGASPESITTDLSLISPDRDQPIRDCSLQSAESSNRAAIS